MFKLVGRAMAKAAKRTASANLRAVNEALKNSRRACAEGRPPTTISPAEAGQGRCVEAEGAENQSRWKAAQRFG